MGYSFPNIHGVVAAAVAIAGYTETAVKILATGDGCLGVAFAIFFWYIGKFLLTAIDRSLQRNTAVEECSGGRRDPALQAARKKVVKIISFFVQQCVMGSILVLFSAHSRYGTEVPLLLFCLPFVLPVQLSMVCTQLFTGRSKLRGTSVGKESTRGRSGLTSRSGLMKRTANRSHRQLVVPTEASTTTTKKTTTTGGRDQDAEETFPPVSLVLPADVSKAPDEEAATDSVVEDPVVPFEISEQQD